MASKPERPRAWFLQSKQRQQMWQAVVGGSSRQDSKQACMRAEMRSYPNVCACVHVETHDVTAKRRGGACALTSVKAAKEKKPSSAYQLAYVQRFCTGQGTSISVDHF